MRGARRSIARGAALLAAGLVALAAPQAANAATCHLRYDLTGWSIFYATVSGTGHVTCENGQSANVRIAAHGGGISLGGLEIRGDGAVSSVLDISEVFGGYVEVMGHAGAGPSAAGWAMTKGDVSLVLSGTGRGVNLGFAFGWLRIRPR